MVVEISSRRYLFFKLAIMLLKASIIFMLWLLSRFKLGTSLPSFTSARADPPKPSAEAACPMDGSRSECCLNRKFDMEGTYWTIRALQSDNPLHPNQPDSPQFMDRNDALHQDQKQDQKAMPGIPDEHQPYQNDMLLIRKFASFKDNSCSLDMTSHPSMSSRIRLMQCLEVECKIPDNRSASVSGRLGASKRDSCGQFFLEINGKTDKAVVTYSEEARQRSTGVLCVPLQPSEICGVIVQVTPETRTFLATNKEGDQSASSSRLDNEQAKLRARHQTQQNKPTPELPVPELDPHEQLWDSVFRGDPFGVFTALRRGADINAQRETHGTVLQAAALRAYRPVVRVLVARGADVNAQGGFLGNPLQAAAAGGSLLIVEMLLNQGADVNAWGGRFGTALNAALELGYEDIAQSLREHMLVVNNRRGGSNSSTI